MLQCEIGAYESATCQLKATTTVIKASFKIATEIFRIFKTQKKIEIKQQVEVIIF